MRVHSSGPQEPARNSHVPISESAKKVSCVLSSISNLFLIARAIRCTWYGAYALLPKRLSFLGFQIHHIKVKMFGREACGWFMFKRFRINWVRITISYNIFWVNKPWCTESSCGDPAYHCLCSMQVVDITPMKHRLTSITSIRVV
jgi:hypothetical protein